jgi:hypothetical protein
MEIKLWHLSRRRRLLNHNAHNCSTIHTPVAQIRGPPTLPPLERLAERERTSGLASSKARETGLLPFRLSLL